MFVYFLCITISNSSLFLIYVAYQGISYVCLLLWWSSCGRPPVLRSELVCGMVLTTNPVCQNIPSLIMLSKLTAKFIHLKWGCYLWSQNIGLQKVSPPICSKNTVRHAWSAPHTMCLSDSDLTLYVDGSSSRDLVSGTVLVFLFVQITMFSLTNIFCQAAHPPPTQPFEHLMMDFLELPTSEGKSHCLVMVNMWSKWVEAFPALKTNCKCGHQSIVKRHYSTMGNS